MASLMILTYCAPARSAAKQIRCENIEIERLFSPNVYRLGHQQPNEARSLIVQVWFLWPGNGQVWECAKNFSRIANDTEDRCSRLFVASYSDWMTNAQREPFWRTW